MFFAPKMFKNKFFQKNFFTKNTCFYQKFEQKISKKNFFWTFAAENGNKNMFF